MTKDLFENKKTIPQIEQIFGNKFLKKENQKFNEEIIIEKAGQKIKIYDWIQENSIDTEIYPTLEKYGCLDTIQRPKPQILQEELGRITSLRDVIEQVEEAEKLFNKLPQDIKKEFGNDKKRFLHEGMKFAEKMIEKEKEQFKEIKNETTTDTQPKGE